MSDYDENNTGLPCADKISFETKREAGAAGVAADWQHGAVLRPYRCRHCTLWHLTTQPAD